MIQNLISTAILLIASMQWYIIGERTIHAYHQWSKFKDYSGNGHTTMNFETVITGYAGSFIIIVAALAMRNFFPASSMANKIRKTSIIMFAIGLIWLSILIVSPYSEVYGF